MLPNKQPPVNLLRLVSWSRVGSRLFGCLCMASEICTACDKGPDQHRPPANPPKLRCSLDTLKESAKSPSALYRQKIETIFYVRNLPNTKSRSGRALPWSWSVSWQARLLQRQS